MRCWPYRSPVFAALKKLARATLLAVLGLCAAAPETRAQNTPPARPGVPSSLEFPDVPNPSGLSGGSAALPKLPSTLAPTGKPTPALTPTPTPTQQGQPTAPQPFGANLFMGNFLRTREDGLNPNYVIMPGDEVAVHTWGAVDVSGAFTVDSQGNIFLPSVGPVHLAGVRNADLTNTVKSGLSRVYSRYLDVYTNLLSANPIAVFVTGGVPRPGKYAGIPSDSIMFFLDQAGGIDAQLGSYRKISVLRADKSIAEVDLYDFMLRGALPSLQFEDGDTILVHRRGPVVELDGTFARPALLEFTSAPITGKDVLGVVPGTGRATRAIINGLRGGTLFNRALSLEQFSGFELNDGDTVALRDDARNGMIVVKLEGEYRGPTELAVRRGSRLVDVLNYIPVDPTLSNVRAIHLRRTSVAQAQKDSIDDTLFRLQRSALLALSSSNGESNIRAKEAELTLRFVESARLIQPLGRVVTSRDQRQVNLLLEDGDVIVVPARTNIVRVGGEVMMAHAVMYRPDMTAEDYIEDAGGYTDRSDQSRVIVIHSNAEVAIADPGTRLLPGDELLVPPRVDTKTLQNVADITTVIYQVAVSAAVVLAIL
ncbi:MAG: polysaccharide biosynthesis/export family protein [Polyangiaceae bacterium]|nr:polysaccharide biosynthesis/export family protein [Polyangiaceae bacterium]